MPASKKAPKKVIKPAKAEADIDVSDAPELNSADAKRKSIELAIKEIKTKFGDEAIMTYGAGKPAAIPFISTGSIGLDAALGVGGLPAAASLKYSDLNQVERRRLRCMPLLKHKRKAASAHSLTQNTRLILNTLERSA